MLASRFHPDKLFFQAPRRYLFASSVHAPERSVDAAMLNNDLHLGVTAPGEPKVSPSTCGDWRGRYSAALSIRFQAPLRPDGKKQ